MLVPLPVQSIGYYAAFLKNVNGVLRKKLKKKKKNLKNGGFALALCPLFCGFICLSKKFSFFCKIFSFFAPAGGVFAPWRGWFRLFFVLLLPAAAALGGCPYTTVKMGVGWGCRKNFFGCRCAPSFFPVDRGGALIRSWSAVSGVGVSENFRGCCSRCRSFFVWLEVPLYDVYNGAFFPIVKIGGGAVPR